jgi:arylsulfatase A
VKPFFLYLAHTGPHTPLHVEEQFRGQSPGGLYGDVVERLDWSTGEILSALQKLGIEKNTLVVFLSDNGPWIPRGENGGIATPLRNGKGSTYEGGLRVPCIACWPNTVPSGKVCDEMVTAMDFLPTFSGLAGCGPLPEKRITDGKDILPLLKAESGAVTPHKAFYYYFMDELQAVRSGPWKLKLETTVARDSLYTPVGDVQSTVPAALYNLEYDPGEQKSVLKDHPDIVRNLEALAQEARNDLGDSALGIQGKNRRPAGSAP